VPYLDGVNDNFSNAVYRTVGYQSAPMKAVIKAVRDYQLLPAVPQLRTLKEALRAWERTHPAEYRDRFASIKAAFESELGEEERSLAPSTLGNIEWVKSRSAALDAFKNYAVEDVLQYMGNTGSGAMQDCLARYSDFAHAAPPPARLGQPINLGIGGLLGSDWNANRARMIYNFMTFANPRTVRYTPSADPKVVPALSATGRRSITSLGSGLCTQFAYAAAHVLTAGRLGGPAIDIVSWMGGVLQAHCYVVIGRELDDPPHMLPPNVDEWGSDIVIVDGWLAALGHKAAYRITNYAGDHPYPGFVRNARVVMSREFEPFTYD
jgi:hypothetical protein